MTAFSIRAEPKISTCTLVQGRAAKRLLADSLRRAERAKITRSERANLQIGRFLTPSAHTHVLTTRRNSGQRQPDLRRSAKAGGRLPEKIRRQAWDMPCQNGACQR